MNPLSYPHACLSGGARGLADTVTETCRGHNIGPRHTLTHTYDVQTISPPTTNPTFMKGKERGGEGAWISGVFIPKTLRKKSGRDCCDLKVIR